MKTIACFVSVGSFLPLLLVFSFASPARAQKPGEAPCCRSSLKITASRSVQLLVNSPNGLETGYDPLEYGGFVHEIPSSDYHLGYASAGAYGGRAVRRLDIGTPAAGRYVVQVIGASGGRFTIEFRASDVNGATAVHKFSGAARPGATFIYFVQYSPDPGAKFNVTPLTPFSSFSANVTIVPVSRPPTFRVNATIGFGAAASFDPIAQPLTFQLGSYTVTIPPGSFIRKDQGKYDYDGTIDGITLDARILPQAGNKFAFDLKVQGINVSSSINPVRVLLILGNNAGAKSVNAVSP